MLEMARKARDRTHLQITVRAPNKKALLSLVMTASMMPEMFISVSLVSASPGA
jgi:hypothetical protein